MPTPASPATRPPWRPWGLGLAGVLAAVILGWAIESGIRRGQRTAAQQRQVERHLPVPTNTGGYASSHQCLACHPGEHASWHRSFHRTMTQPALPETVLGRFDGSTIRSAGLDYRVSRDADGLWAEMPDPDVMMYVVQGGKKLAEKDIPRVRQPVVMATGSHHYQTYWVASPRYPGLLQTLPLVYLPRDDQWIPREEAFMHGHTNTHRFITQWNHHCIRCHSTGGNPGLNRDTGQLESKVGELGISCEACHGPGESHIRHHRNPVNRYLAHRSTAPDPTIVNPAHLDHERSSQVCGQCHGVYVMRDEFAMQSAYEGALYRPGEDLHRTRYYIGHPANDPSAARVADRERNPDFFRERWWDDGTILAGGREYTALRDTACFREGKLSCLHCHSMHESDPNDQLKAGADGPAGCIECHREARFTSDLRSHTFHAPGSSGSNCLNCHMPHTTYALLTAIRSHQIDSPRVERSARHGTPNACNLCHLDRTLAWTQEHLVTRYGQTPVDLTAEQRDVSAALVWLLRGNAAQRVIAGWHFGWAEAQAASGTNWLAPFTARLLADPYGVVRYVGARSLRTQPGFAGFAFDFLADREQLAARARIAEAQWPGLPTDTPARPELLLQAGGRVDARRVSDLLRRRDQRSVVIKE